MRIAKSLCCLLFALIVATGGAARASQGAADPVRAHGTAVIKTQMYETMVIVRTVDGDGPADHVFHVWSKPALQVDGGWRNVGVEFNGTSLALIFPETRSVITFTVGGASAPAILI